MLFDESHRQQHFRIMLAQYVNLENKETSKKDAKNFGKY